jgi:membrane fusion protein, multidrug efflux system
MGPSHLCRQEIAMRRASFLIVILVAFAAMTAIVAIRALVPSDEAGAGRGARVLPVAIATVPSVEFADIVEALGTARAN